MKVLEKEGGPFWGVDGGCAMKRDGTSWRTRFQMRVLFESGTGLRNHHFHNACKDSGFKRCEFVSKGVNLIRKM